MDIVGPNLGWKMLWKGGAGQLGWFFFLSTLMWARIFSPMSEFTGSSIEVKCKPVKKYKRAPEKRMSEPVKSPYGVGHYCDMAVSPTRSHLLCIWLKLPLWWIILMHICQKLMNFSKKYFIDYSAYQSCIGYFVKT